MRLRTFILFALVGLSNSGCVIGYSVRAGIEHLRMMNERVPIIRVIKENRESGENIEKLQHVINIRDYARDRIGLNAGGTYETIVFLDRNAVSWNVTASEPLAFEPLTWWFPIIGSVPYLGFFNEDRAHEFEAELSVQGWDARISRVVGYSTLGWFDDPLFSPQLSMDEIQLTRVILHELTHSTVWIAEKVNFNESLASFVEIQGALEYYSEHSSLADIKELKRRLESERRIISLYFEFTNILEEIYKNESITQSEKKRLKKVILSRFKSKFIELQSNAPGPTLDRIRRREFNNADFLSANRYDFGFEFFKKMYKEAGSWEKFFEIVSKYANERDADFSALDEKR